MVYSVIPFLTTRHGGAGLGFPSVMFITRAHLQDATFGSTAFSDLCPVLAADDSTTNILVDQAIPILLNVNLMVAGSLVGYGSRSELLFVGLKKAQKLAVQVRITQHR